MGDAYKDANVELSKNLTKRNIKQQKRDVINFIKNNPSCTVTEIQDMTKVNVVRIFKTIKKAYDTADVKYPEKEVTSGVRNPDVVERCNKYEKRIVQLLGNFGQIKPKVRTTAGIVDCLFKYNNENFVVEIKDFRGKNNITMHEIKQLMRYMKFLNYSKGIIVCPKESFPKRKNSRNIYIENLIIKILSEEDLWGRSINL